MWSINAHAQIRKFEQPDEMGAYDRWGTETQQQDHEQDGSHRKRKWADALLFANL